MAIYCHGAVIKPTAMNTKPSVDVRVCVCREKLQSEVSTIRALSALDYLNLDPCILSVCGDLYSLLDEEKVKCFVEDVRSRRC